MSHAIAFAFLDLIEALCLSNGPGLGLLTFVDEEIVASCPICFSASNSVVVVWLLDEQDVQTGVLEATHLDAPQKVVRAIAKLRW